MQHALLIFGLDPSQTKSLERRCPAFTTAHSPPPTAHRPPLCKERPAAIMSSLAA